MAIAPALSNPKPKCRDLGALQVKCSGTLVLPCQGPGPGVGRKGRKKETPQ